MDEMKKNIATLLSDGEPSSRRRAAEELASVAGFAPIAALAAALRDDNKGVRDAASRSLSSIGNKNVARAVVEYLADQNITTRNLAAELLMHLKGESTDALLPYLYDADQDVRKFVVDILGTNGSPEAANHLIALLEDKDDNVVVSAIEALGNIRSETAVPALIRSFEQSPYTRATVAEALGKVGGKASGEFLVAVFDRSITQPDSDPLVLFAVLEALATVGNEATFDVLSRHLQDVRKGKLRRALLHALIRVGERCQRTISAPENLVNDFADALGDDSPAIQVSAAKGMNSLAGDSATSALVKVVAKNDELDAVVLQLLEQREGVFHVIIAALESGEVMVSKEILGVLSKILVRTKSFNIPEDIVAGGGSLLQRAFDAIKNSWSSSPAEVRAAALDVLFRLDGDQAVRFLDAIVNEPDPWIRMHVIELLAPLDDARVSEFIARFLTDDDEMVRELAATILASRGVDPEQK